MSARIRAIVSAKTLRYLIVIGLIGLWELLPRTGLIPELFLPSLSSTLIAGWTDAAEYGHALAVTLYEVVVSMAFACGGGILLGAIVGSLPRPRILIMPMVSSLYAVPLVILYPVFTVWLGIGSESKIAFASIYGFLPTMLATAAGPRAPMAVSTPVTANMIQGISATRPATSFTAPRTSRSTVPLFCAMANR